MYTSNLSNEKYTNIDFHTLIMAVSMHSTTKKIFTHRSFGESKS